VRTHERVLACIEADLAAGRWAVGERLPGERALAEELEVSRPSVREALRVLEAMGIVRTAVGSGPDSGATVVDHPAAGLGSAVRLHLASGALPVQDVVELRVLLETWAVGAAARRTPAPSFDEAEALLDQMDAPGVGVEEFLELDTAFHVALAAASGNVLVEAVMLGLRGAIGAYVTEGTRRLEDWQTTAERLRAEHREVLRAVRDGAASEAGSAVAAHIDGFYRDTGLERRGTGGAERPRA
jgi:GntR family transcriptional repressor for pyruvate dehydrogenase complex